MCVGSAEIGLLSVFTNLTGNEFGGEMLYGVSRNDSRLLICIAIFSWIKALPVTACKFSYNT
jgi:hypothetical protein